MSNPEKRNPVDHLRSFVSGFVASKTNGEAVPPSIPGTEEASVKPFRGRNIVVDKGEDKTLKFVLLGSGGIILLVFLLLALSQKHVPHRAKANQPDLGRAQSQGNSASALRGNIVPRASMEPSPAGGTDHGKITPRDLESNVPSTKGNMMQNKSVVTTPAQNLGQIKPFNSGQLERDNWAPKPYTGQMEPSQNVAERAEAASPKPSLVFVASATSTPSPSSPAESLTPSLGLSTGARLSARITSIVTTAVDLPILAVVEYNYEQNGEIVVPAGTVAVGHIQQADRSGYLSIRFDRLEMPDKTVVPIDAVATNRNLGPLKGKVSGTHAGRSFLVRSVTGIGSAAAMLVGQNNTGGSISEEDLLRADVAENIGRAGDQQVMQLMMAEHPIVTLSAGADVFLVFEKTGSRSINTIVAAPSSRLSQQNLNELRELLQLQREMNQNTTTMPNSSPNQ